MDALTKHAEHDMLREHVEGISLQISSSMHNTMPSVAYNVICSVEYPQRFELGDVRSRVGLCRRPGVVGHIAMSEHRPDEVDQPDACGDAHVFRSRQE